MAENPQPLDAMNGKSDKKEKPHVLPGQLWRKGEDDYYRVGWLIWGGDRTAVYFTNRTGGIILDQMMNDPDWVCLEEEELSKEDDNAEG